MKIIRVPMRKSSGVIVLPFLLIMQIFAVITINSVTANSVTSTMHEKVDIFEGRFSSQDISLTPNQVMDLSFSICPIMDAPDTVIRFIMPADLVTLVKGQQIWKGDVKQGETLNLDFSIAALEEVDAHVRVDVESSSEGTNFRSSFYLHVTTLTTKLNLESSEDVQLPARQLDSSLSYEDNLVTESADGTITIEGRFSYVNDTGDPSPMRSVLVKLMDSDFIGEETVATQYTNYNGEFSFTVNNDDGVGQGGRDPYIEVYSEGGAATCKTDGGAWYVITLPKCGDDVPDGFYHNYGHRTSSSEAWGILDACLEERDWIYYRGGQNWQRSKVDVRWPSACDPMPHSHGDRICLPPKTTTAWDRITVYHEYAHSVMYALYGHFPGPTVYSHHPSMETNPGNAMCEGWAEFLQAAVEFDPTNMEWNGQNIETNNWYDDEGTGNMDGDIVEGSVASILWDIYDYYDASDQDDMYFLFDEIFTVIHDAQPDNIHQFWTAWTITYPASQGPLSTVYWHYGIDKDYYAPHSGSVLINDGDTYCTQILVTLTLTCDDYGSGPRYMRIKNTYTGSWTWEDYDTSTSWLLYNIDDGTKPIFVQFKDEKGYESDIYYDTIILDREKPSGSIVINKGNPTYTDSTLVTLYLSFSDTTSGVDKVRFRNEDEKWTDWEKPLFTKVWTLSSGDGIKIVRYQIRDNVGLTATYEDEIILRTDPTYPEPTYLVVRGLDDRIYYRTCSYGVWGDWKAVPTGTTCDAPAAVVYAGKLYMVVRGMTGDNLWFGSVDLSDDTFSDWSYLSGSTPSKPTLVCWEKGQRLILVVQGNDNRIYHRHYDLVGESWFGWNTQIPGSTPDSPAAAVDEDYLYLAVRGMRGDLYYMNFSLNIPAMPGWTWIGGSTPSAPTLVSNYRSDGDDHALYLMVRGMNNEIYMRSYYGTWSSWNTLPGSTNDAVGACIQPSKPAPDAALHIVVRGMTGGLYHGKFDLNSANFLGWTLMDGDTPSPPTLTS